MTPGETKDTTTLVRTMLNSHPELAMPHETKFLIDAFRMRKRWGDLTLPENRELVKRTRGFLRDVPVKAQQTQDNLLEIIMAQDFQDLTGQVITRMLGVVGTIETELVQVLVDNVPTEKREETQSLINGPVVSPVASEVVTSQDQVDDLLANLGF